MEDAPPPRPGGPEEEAGVIVPDDQSALDDADSQAQSSSLAAAGTTAGALHAAAVDTAGSDVEAAMAPLPDAPLPDAPLPDAVEEVEDEDAVKAMSRSLSQLSIPDLARAGGDGAEGVGCGDTPGSDGEASLFGLEELPPELSPGKANFSHVGAGRAGQRGCLPAGAKGWHAQALLALQAWQVLPAQPTVNC